MPDRALVITRAESRLDLRAAAGILDEAAWWLASRGLPGWRPGSFSRSGTLQRRVLLSAFRSGDLFLGWEGGQAVATVSLLWEDRLYWPDAAADAGYVHRLAVRRNAAGRGVGRAVLRWAEGQTRSRGKRYLRLNCSARDPGIRSYYERAGFVHRRDATVRGADMSLYEKDLSVGRLGAGSSR
jgi:GNAT superfamily N-acetyltransferase